MNPIKLEKYKKYTDKNIIKAFFEDKPDEREVVILEKKDKRSQRRTYDWQSRNHIEKIKKSENKVHPEEMLTDGGSRSGQSSKLNKAKASTNFAET